MNLELRGSWQKPFVKKLIEAGLSHEHAMIAMAQTCEERASTYMQGYNKGYNDGFTAGKSGSNKSKP